MGFTYKYRMLSGLESSGGVNVVWVEAATAAELATSSAASGSIGTIAGDPDSLYVFDGTTWNLIDKEGLAAGVSYEGISPQTVLLIMKLLAVPLVTLGTAATYSVLTTRGDIIYRGAALPTRLPKGTEGMVLKQGANDPIWIIPHDLGFTDTGSKYTTDTLGAALVQLGPLLDADKRQYYLRTTKPTTEADQVEGMLVYSSDTDCLQICRTPGEQEIDSLEVTAGAVTTPGAGHVTIALNGVDKEVELNGGTLDVHNGTITGAATGDGDITLTLDGTAIPVTVANLDTAAAVAGKVTAAMAANANWTVGNVDAVLTFTAKAVGVKAGAFSFDGGTTGVTCTAGITETTPGVAADTINGVATKIRAAEYTGWTTGGADAVVTFTKDAVGACSAPTFTDTDTTGAAGTFTRTNQGVTDIWEGDGWHDWIPALTWGTADPATITKVARYMIQNHTLFFNVYISSADGNDASSLTIGLPYPPKDNNSFITPHALQLIDTAWREAMAYIDDGASVIGFYNFGVCTDAAACKFIVSGQYEIA
jgi:hypothetical protein